MSVFKCKMCGSTLKIQNHETVATCEYCSAKQTLPRLENEKRAHLYDRASQFRRNNEFDKAAVIYEQIVAEDPDDAEAYWSLVLCRYGIEYVETPAKHTHVPTIHRAQFTSIFADADYKATLEHADVYQKAVYEEEAEAIDKILQGILAISQNEEPFDVFICCKETDHNGRRTKDSVLAEDIYHKLTQEGFKVFFARITLGDKPGDAYEPYIFAALNSAKVMIVLGTHPGYFDAVWVKNEWGRFLALTKDNKKTLIPVYKDMYPYDLPREFANLQAQDMNKFEFMQDLIREIKKLVDDQPIQSFQAVPVCGFAMQEHGDDKSLPLMKRVLIFLEDEEWTNADEYCEKVLDLDPENAQAYLCKMMVELRVSCREDLGKQEQSFEDNINFKRAKRFASPELLLELDGYVQTVRKREADMKKAFAYQQATRMMETDNGGGSLLIKIGVIVCLIAVSSLIVFALFPSFGGSNTPKATPIVSSGIGADVTVGDIVKFGSYEQDNNTANGPEKIERKVLDKKDGKALLISKYGLDCQPYNTSYTAVTWETCTLRSWLNSTFYRTAFNSTQQALIAETAITNPDNPYCGTDGGNYTTDNVFLLSIDEVNRYFASNSMRMCAATVYAQAQDALSFSGGFNWWLRSPGEDRRHAAFVIGAGSIYLEGAYVHYGIYVVRPTIWVNLES